MTKKRLYLISGIHASSYVGTLLILNEAWYKGYPKTSFHTFNDSKEWLQVDKVGHAWSAFYIARFSQSMWRWAGVDYKKSVWLGGISSVTYQTILELLDAHSAEWGWSWADVSANIFGASLFTAQELLWKEQKVKFRFSSFPIQYPAALNERVNQLYGRGFATRLLKDYNAQTYWLSLNVGSVWKNRNLPPWLNVAIGYGAKGVYGGFENKGYDKNGTIIFDGSGLRRQRQWYLSPDIDWTKIKTGKKGVRLVLLLMNMIKIPAPALEFSGNGLKAHLLYF